MEKAQFFPIVIFVLLSLFFSSLPDLRRCALPAAEGELRIDRKDTAVMALICLVYGAVAFTGLGSTQSPQSFAPMYGSTVVFELPGDESPAELRFFCGVGEGQYSVEFSEDGSDWYMAGSFNQDYIAVLKWNSFHVDCPEFPRYARICGSGGVYLGELVFLDAQGSILPVKLDSAMEGTGAEMLIDEQRLMPETSNYLNSSYFDEIYHARTAWEHLHGVYPYEISHPPLGKLIISLGISLFGMTPFGWRFSGTFFGLLMLPVMYIFTKKLFGGRAVPAACTAVLATDFMHFVQTRIATIDTYGVFFMLLMYLFMYLFVCEKEDGRRASLYLALSGLFFGLGAASKWTDIYAGAGLAVIWALYWILNRDRGFKAFLKNAAFCLVFFVLLPGLIYYLSYYPYGLASGMKAPAMFFSREYADIVLKNQEFMFSYHSGLVAEHPYSSRWYQWLLDIRPILYYLEYYDDGTRSSFGAFVNPLLCWGGIVALAMMAYTAIGRRDRQAGFLLIAYLAQLLPWVLISRLTFEYHYFPCSAFLVPAMGYVFKLIRQENRRWKWFLGGFVLASAALFVLFYPALTGQRVDNSAASALLGWLPTWPF